MAVVGLFWCLLVELILCVGGFQENYGCRRIKLLSGLEDNIHVLIKYLPLWEEVGGKKIPGRRRGYFQQCKDTRGAEAGEGRGGSGGDEVIHD